MRTRNTTEMCLKTCIVCNVRRCYSKCVLFVMGRIAAEISVVRTQYGCNVLKHCRCINGERKGHSRIQIVVIYNCGCQINLLNDNYRAALFLSFRVCFGVYKLSEKINYWGFFPQSLHTNFQWYYLYMYNKFFIHFYKTYKIYIFSVLEPQTRNQFALLLLFKFTFVISLKFKL